MAAAVTDEHDGVAARRAQQRAEARDPDHLHRGRDEDAGQGGERGCSATQREATSTMTSRTAAWVTAASRDTAPGADVDRRAGDGCGGGDAAEERRGEVGDALPDELPVGVVPLPDAHGVGHRGRQQALERGQGSHGDGGEQERVEVGQGDGRERGRGSPAGIVPIVARPRASTALATVAQHDDDERPTAGPDAAGRVRAPPPPRPAATRSEASIGCDAHARGGPGCLTEHLLALRARHRGQPGPAAAG